MARELLGEMAARRAAKALTGAFGKVLGRRSSAAARPVPKREGISQSVAEDLLRRYYRPEESYVTTTNAWQEKNRILRELEKHMPVSIRIPEDRPPERFFAEPLSGLTKLAGYLSVLSKLPPETFSRAGKVGFSFLGPPKAYFKLRPLGDPERGIYITGVPRHAPEEVTQYAPLRLAHEAVHSLLYPTVGETYEKILRFLDATGWKFPRPDRSGWEVGSQFAPSTYDDLSQMFYQPYWPREGLPETLPPSSWRKGQPFETAGVTYAERHPVEDLAESGAYRILESYPVMAEAESEALAGGIRGLQENVRHGPITEVLRAAGVPLVWLLMLLQRRYGQPGSRQEEAL